MHGSVDTEPKAEGGGFPVDQMIRAFAGEYNHRALGHGSEKAGANVLQPLTVRLCGAQGSRYLQATIAARGPRHACIKIKFTSIRR